MTNSENNNIEHIIRNNGIEYWQDSNTNVHQDEDLPAEIHPDGTEIYWKKGKLFRKYGPTIKHPDGDESWRIKMKNYFYHRKDGATAILPNGKRKYSKSYEEQ